MKSRVCAIPPSIAIAVFGVFFHANGYAQDSWVDRIEFKGDFRPRLELIDRDEDSIGQPVDERRRGRFRLRFGAAAEVNDTVDFIFELASGGENPVSSNQSFDGGFTTKDIGINLAYVDWQAAENLNVMLGKIKNPFHRPGGHHLIWDSDLNTEGLSVQFENDDWFAMIGGYGVEERSSGDDSMLYTFQGGYTFQLSEAMSLTAGAGYYMYTETQGNSPFWNGDPFGNSVDAQGNFLYDYNQVQGFVELAMKAGNLPLSFFVDYVQNTEAPQFDTGYAFGGKLGKADEPKTWEASIAYQDLEADAILALFTDSDYGGGGTDATGFTIKGKYSLMKNWMIAGTLFLNEIEENLGFPTDYTRFQFDFEFKF